MKDNFIGWTMLNGDIVAIIKDELKGNNWFKVLHPSRIDGMNQYQSIDDQEYTCKIAWGRTCEEAKEYYMKMFGSNPTEMKQI